LRSHSLAGLIAASYSPSISVALSGLLSTNTPTASSAISMSFCWRKSMRSFTNVKIWAGNWKATIGARDLQNGVGSITVRYSLWLATCIGVAERVCREHATMDQVVVARRSPGLWGGGILWNSPPSGLELNPQLANRCRLVDDQPRGVSKLLCYLHRVDPRNGRHPRRDADSEKHAGSGRCTTAAYVD